MKTERYNAMVCSLMKDNKEFVVVLGGDETSSKCECYDVSKGQWFQLPPMPLPRYGSSVFVLSDSKVLIVGGRKRGFSKCLCDAILFDLSAPSKERMWERVPEMDLPFEIECQGSLTFSGNINLLYC